MSFSKLTIFNLALMNLGVTVSLQSVEDEDPKAVSLNAFYDLARGQVLKDYDWNFASAYRNLSLTESGTSDNPLYKYEFDYPNDCLCAREIVSLDPYLNIDFEVATNFSSNSRVINTNIQNPVLRYTKNLDKEVFFTPEFVMALSWYLSFLACDAIGLGSKKENAMKIYVSMLQNAKVSNANEGFENKERDADWLDARN